MQIGKNRTIERAGVNAARAFFESERCVFQEVDQANDYGKDAYVDLVDGTIVTGSCCALQIKSGSSYKRSNDYFIPVDEHAASWRESTVPIFGVVFDPDDSKLRWAPISSYLAANPSATRIPVRSDSILNRETLKTTFKSSLRESVASVFRDPLTRLFTPNNDAAAIAIQDCFALSRNNAGALIGLRYILRALRGRNLFIAINYLSHATPHPDIFWTNENWLPEAVKQQIRTHLSWSPDEIVHLLSEVPFELWERGRVGQSLEMLLNEDSDIETKWPLVINYAFLQGFDEAAHTALYRAVAYSDNPKHTFELLSAPHRKKWESWFINEITQTLHEFGYVSIY